MRVEFVKKKNRYSIKVGKEFKKAGDTADLSDAQANKLIKQGYCKLVESKENKPQGGSK